MSNYYRLGRKSPNLKRKKVHLSAILDKDIICPTSFDNRGTIVDWKMDANDSLGDCTIAALEHLVVCWRQMLKLSDDGITEDQVIALYSLYTGYNPADPSTDQGAVEQDVLTKAQDLGFFNRKIQGYASIGTNNKPHIMWAGKNLGAVYIGVQLPITAQGQDMWDVTDPTLSGDAAPGSWGGHAIIVVQADATGLWVVTWGKLLRVTWAFWTAYVDEVWAVIPDQGDFFTADGNAPSGLNEAALAKLMSEL